MATDLTIIQGKTFTRVLRWESLPYVYKPIQSITKAAPAVVGVTGHGVPDGWRVAIVSVKGMTEINAQNTPPKEREYVKATVVDPNTLSLNSVNSLDFSDYVSGGVVQYYTPVDLASYTGRMQIKDKIGGTVLASTDTDDAPNNVITITVNNTTKTITLTIPATATAAFTWKKGVYDLEMVNGSTVVGLLSGAITVTPEVTTAT